MEKKDEPKQDEAASSNTTEVPPININLNKDNKPNELDLIKEESSTKKHRSGSRSSLERKEQKRKARDMMKLDKGSDLAKDELREKRKIRKDFL